jgi:hypothetical protein
MSERVITELVSTKMSAENGQLPGRVVTTATRDMYMFSVHLFSLRYLDSVPPEQYGEVTRSQRHGM